MYIVASQGASPSGRLMAVAGRGSRPERDLGRGFEVEGVRGELVLEGWRGFWRVFVGGVPVTREGFRVWVGVGLVRVAVGEPLLPGREAGVGMLYDASGSSRRTWLPTLFPRLRIRLYERPVSSPVQLPLAPRFRGRGVSRSMCPCGMGMGLDRGSGMREELLRRSCCVYRLDEF